MPSNQLNRPGPIPEALSKTQQVKKTAFILNVEDLSNQELVNRALKTGLIEQGQSAKDVATKLKSYDIVLGELVDKIVDQNNRRKRGSKKRNPYLVGNDPTTGEYISNPSKYLEIISDYIFKNINSGDKKEGYNEWMETRETLVATQTTAKGDLMSCLSM